MPFLTLVLIVVVVVIALCKFNKLLLAVSFFVGAALCLPLLPSWVLKPDTGTLFILLPIIPVALFLAGIALLQGAKALIKKTGFVEPVLSLLLLLLPALGYL